MDTQLLQCETTVNESVLRGLRPNSILIGSIDQGTSSTRFLIFTQNGQIAAMAQMEHTQIFPPGKLGWHEHDPLQIWENTLTCVRSTLSNIKEKCKIDLGSPQCSCTLKAIGIANQRETTIAWNAQTGKPYYNAIVWDDIRTFDIASEVANGNIHQFRDKTGLPIVGYFTGMKVRWLMDHVTSLRVDLQDPVQRTNVRFGTIDTWLIYQMTGIPTSKSEPNVANIGGRFITDVSNASRWLFLNIHTIKWDTGLICAICEPSGLQVPLSALPQIVPSSDVYDTCSVGFGVPELEHVPIASIMGDQQAALFGQGAFKPGESKNTYGTGLFLMMNTGEMKVFSKKGLLTTVAYQVGKNGPVIYALEGSVAHSGSSIQWLRDQLKIIDHASESEEMAKKTTGNEGLYFVPAFSGLFAPHWRSDARACIVGMARTHTCNHVVRAALEATAYQTCEVFDAMYSDFHGTIRELRVDGRATTNNLLLQFQADMLDTPVVRPVVMETTAQGAAFAAGLAVGAWKDMAELRALWKEDVRFEPSMSALERARNWAGWQRAVTKSFDSVTGNDKQKIHSNITSNIEDKKLSSKHTINISTLVWITFVMIIGWYVKKNGRT